MLFLNSSLNLCDLKDGVRLDVPRIELLSCGAWASESKQCSSRGSMGHPAQAIQGCWMTFVFWQTAPRNDFPKVLTKTMWFSFKSLTCRSFVNFETWFQLGFTSVLETQAVCKMC